MSLNDRARPAGSAITVLRAGTAKRQRGGSEWTYRELAAKTGWSLGSIAKCFDGKALPPTDRFDAVIVVRLAREPIPAPVVRDDRA